MRSILAAAFAAMVASVLGCGGDVGKEIGKAGDAAKTAAGEAVDTAKEKAGEAVDTAKEKAGEAADAAKEKTEEVVDAAKELTVDGVNVGTELTALVDKIKEALGGVTDKATAETAADGLKSAETNLDGLMEKIGKLPAGAAPALKAIAAKSLETLQPLIEKALKIEGVGEVIKPVLDGLLAKLKTAAGEK